MEVLAQSALLVALTSFAFGLSTWAKNVRNKLYILFAIGCLVLSAWALFFFFSTIWPTRGWYGWHLSLNAWVTPAALAFMQSMMRIDHWKSSRFMFWGSLALCVIMTIALILGLERHEWIKSVIYYTPTLVLIQTVILMFVDHKLQPTVGISRRFILYVGVLLLLMTCVMDHIPGLWVGIPIFGNLALTVFLYFLSQALLQQRLLNFGVLFSRFLVLISIAFLLTLVYSLVAVWVGNDFGLFFLNSFITSFVLISIIEPIRTMVRYATEGMLSKKHRRLQQKIQEASKQLVRVVEPHDALKVFEAFLQETLAPRGLAFFLEENDALKLRKQKEVGSGELVLRAPSEFPRIHPIVEAMEKFGGDSSPVVVLDQMLETERERMAGHGHRERYQTWIDALHAHGANVAIPFFVQDEFIGFALLDVPTPPEEWGANWSILKAVEPVAAQTSEILKKSELFQRKREIERLATLGEMAAGLAHEIRNPLGAIKGAAQYLDPSANRPESRFLSVIVEEVDRLNHVVTQFLDYSKPNPVMQHQSVDLNKLAQKMVTLLSTTAPKGVDLRFQTSLLDARVKGSPEQLHQVLLNLIQNSFKALSREKDHAKRVLVSVEKVTTKDGEKIRINVEDNGPGIPAEALPKIFIPFYTTDPSGTGLGLSICQKIIQAHGGIIEVRSEPGFSTLFQVTLPKP